jgi:Domain of unknown function (DUF4190)
MSSGGFDRQAGASGPPYGQPPYGQPPYGQYGVSRRTNPLAVASLCCGVAQVIAGPFAGIPAIVLGFMARNQIRQTGEDGDGMAAAGVALGIVGTALEIIGLILLIAIWNHLWQQR